MKYLVILSPDAQSDIQLAQAWYFSKSPELAHRFESILRVGLERLKTHPKAYTLIGRKVRRALLPTFPYAIYFEVQDTLVSVIGVFHQHREDSIRWN